MGDNEVTLICGHCHQQVTAFVRATYSSTYDEEFGLSVNWRLLQCSFCFKPLLDELDSETEPTLIRRAYPGLPEKWERVPTILYPIAKFEATELPPQVVKAYEDALAVQTVSPRACAVMIGRTLEAVCTEHNVQGRNLAARLETLASDGRMPPTLAEMARQIRTIRNFGAHADEEDEVTEEDASVLTDFLEAILEYLYIAPRKVQQVETRLHRNH